jgi:anti-sigma-K factor RskA
MSDNGTREPKERGTLIAAEYVLGVLDAAQRQAAERRLGRDLAFAREVAYWEERLGGLADAVPPVEPPLGGWARIEAALARADRATEAKPGFWHNLPLWRSLALASTTLAAACIAALIYVGMVPLTAPLLARLDAESGQARFVAAVNPGGGSLTIVPASLLSAEQKSMELWLIPPGEKPHSLGLIDPNRPVTISVPENLLPKVSSESILAVSLEPPGGSPTGQPTGPVIANGKLATL